ncbi:MAG TPA: hypothetical protein VK524_13935 [Polyangiaceae bacterium]|nr:hypothetical protein [Polyangiaceae bacterium]
MKVFAAGLSVLLGLSLLGACGAVDDITGDDEASSRGKRCGNSRIDRDEQCDKRNLNGETCASATMGSRPGGTLSCTKKCRFDTKRCSGAGTGGAAGTGGGGGAAGSAGTGGVAGGGGAAG